MAQATQPASSETRSTSMHPVSPDTCHLFRLSAELQNMIYEHVLVEPPPNWHEWGRPFGGYRSSSKSHIPSMPALTQVCRKIRSETLAMCYDRHIFAFAWTSADGYNRVRESLKALGPNVHLIQRLHLDCCGTDHYFSVTIEAVGEEQASCWTNEWPVAWGIQADHHQDEDSEDQDEDEDREHPGIRKLFPFEFGFVMGAVRKERMDLEKYLAMTDDLEKLRVQDKKVDSERVLQGCHTVYRAESSRPEAV